MNYQSFSVQELKNKAENYCAYQERCHKDVVQKLYELRATSDETNEIIVHLIHNNYLNEERFAKSFVRGKHFIKKYGKNRIVQELKLREISSKIIETALKEIPEDHYFKTFEEVSEKTWLSISEKNSLKKKKKFCDTLIRKGYESNLIYESWKEFSEK